MRYVSVLSIFVLLVISGCAGMGLGGQSLVSLDLRASQDVSTVKIPINGRLALLVPTPDDTNMELGGASFDSNQLSLEGFLYSTEMKANGLPAYATYTFHAIAPGEVHVKFTVRPVSGGDSSPWRMVDVRIE